MNKFFLFFKQFAVWLNGVSFPTARYFAGWKGGANYHLLKNFEINKSEVLFVPGKNKFPTALLDCFDKDVNILYDTCKRFAPSAVNGTLQLTANCNDFEVRVLLDSAQNTFVFNEVFYQEVYGFFLNETCVIVDVGMNIGMASLYFASAPFVEKIYSYELLPATYAMAEKNFAANAKLSVKIQPFNFGWGLVDGEFLLKDARSGATDTTIMGAENVDSVEEIVGSTVRVKSAANELRQICEQHPSTSIVLKLDVEGIEYDLLPNLLKAGVLGSLRGVMLEWHKRGPEELLKVLGEAGFKITYRMDPAFEGNLGMIYAWR